MSGRLEIDQSHLVELDDIVFVVQLITALLCGPQTLKCDAVRLL